MKQKFSLISVLMFLLSLMKILCFKGFFLNSYVKYVEKSYYIKLKVRLVGKLGNSSDLRKELSQYSNFLVNSSCFYVPALVLTFLLLSILLIADQELDDCLHGVHPMPR